MPDTDQQHTGGPDASADQPTPRTEIEIVGDQAKAAPGEFDVLREEIRELKERLIRSQADFDNARKRLRKEADEAGTRAVIRFVRPILDQLDNFTRALNAAKPDAFAEFAQGVSMIRENLLSALDGAGIERVPAEGVFDPAVHEVIAEEPRDDVAKGVIVSVHREGWKLKDQLVRAAQVVVAKPKG